MCGTPNGEVLLPRSAARRPIVFAVNSPEQPVFAEERRRQIAEAVKLHGRVRLADLVQVHGVAEQTIRKDLEELQRRRLLKRTHGGAIAVEPQTEQPLSERTSQNADAKRRIGDAIARFLQPGQSVFLDSGSTLEAVAAHLTSPNVNVLTNAIEVARLLADKPGVRHTLVGGQLRSLGGTLVGPVAQENLRKFMVDIAVLGASGLNEEGVSVADVAEAQLKQTAIERARKVVLAMDSSKFGRRDFAEVCSLDYIDIVFTEAADPQIQEWCDDHGTTLEVIE
jgi:DeoR family fructose operon transcriptional repressor